MKGRASVYISQNTSDTQCMITMNEWIDLFR